jgi:hypothetical protein
MTLLYDGANTKAEATIAAIDSGDWTWIGHAYPVSTGEGAAGSLFIVTDGGGGLVQFFRFDSGNTLIARQIGTTSASSQGSDTISTGVWIYLGSPTSPMIEGSYFGGRTSVVTRTTGGVNFCAGNKGTQSQTFDGSLGPQCFAAREWSIAEMDYFRRTGRPASMAALRVWLPMHGTYATEPDLSGQTSGAVVTSGGGQGQRVPLWVPNRTRARAAELRR